jgi:hypothetical protein
MRYDAPEVAELDFIGCQEDVAARHRGASRVGGVRWCSKVGEAGWGQSHKGKDGASAEGRGGKEEGHGGKEDGHDRDVAGSQDKAKTYATPGHAAP